MTIGIQNLKVRTLVRIIISHSAILTIMRQTTLRSFNQCFQASVLKVMNSIPRSTSLLHNLSNSTRPNMPSSITSRTIKEAMPSNSIRKVISTRML